MIVKNKTRVHLPQKWHNKSVAAIVAEILARSFAHLKRPVLVAFGGTGGVGKSTLTKQIAEILGNTAILTLDDYKTSRQERQNRKILGSHPAANRLDLLQQHLADLKAGNNIERPVYNAVTGEIEATEIYQTKKYNLLDGEISTYRELSHHADFIVFVEAAFHTQLKTRLMRDVAERGSSHFKALSTFYKSNLLDYHRFGKHGKGPADLLVFCERDYKLIPVSINQDFL